ncbi:MAG TPA: apolipoprotein N-acyltransferase, partial [Gemmatimonadota bacterium]|nr:apolipoprotein N-acyltransferase [Gemmatimonadota bacterium]
MTVQARGPIAAWWWWPPAAGVLFALAYPPLNLLPLAIAGLWPFLAFLDREEGARPRAGFVGGYLFGLAHFGALLYWIAGLTGFSVMAVPAYVASVLVMGLNGALTGLAVALCRRRGVSVAISFPLAWTAVEWLRSFGDLGFTWAVAGDTLASYPLLIQTAELGGVWLLTLWVTGLSAALYRLAWPLPSTRRVRVAVLAVVLAAAVPVYGALRLADLAEEMAGWPTLRAAAVQPNVPQEVKWDPAFVDETYRRLGTLTLEADRRRPDLVVWPESAVPGYLRYDDRARALVTGLSRTIEAPIFTGTNDADTLSGASGEDSGDYRVFNAAYLVSGDSILPGRYAKRRLVPIAERVPFLPSLLGGFFETLSDWTGQFAPGTGWTTWTVDGVSFGVLICYESVFPGSSRALVQSGAELLLNITNDAWFGRTAAPFQHASHLSLRAVEHRVSFLRAANTGISGWVDPLGRYQERTEIYVPGLVVADLPVPGIETPYTRWGPWVPLLCLV